MVTTASACANIPTNSSGDAALYITKSLQVCLCLNVGLIKTRSHSLSLAKARAFSIVYLHPSIIYTSMYLCGRFLGFFAISSHLKSLNKSVGSNTFSTSLSTDSATVLHALFSRTEMLSKPFKYSIHFDSYFGGKVLYPMLAAYAIFLVPEPTKSRK